MPRAGSRQPRPGRLFGMGVGQLVATQVAAVALAVGAVNGTVGLAIAAPFALVLLAITWLRLRGRWAYEWWGICLRFAGRRHAVALEQSPTALLEMASPGARVEHADFAGEAAAVIVDSAGFTAVLELGDPAGLLAGEHPTLPSPASLLPPAGLEHPPVRIQLLFTGVPAPALRSGGGTPANSYRQLTGGRVLGHSRALLAVRVLHAEGFSEQDLRRALSGLVRKLPRRLPVPARPLGEAATARIFAELGHHDGSGSAHETWPGLRLGGLTHATFRVYAGRQARDAAGGHRDHDGRGPDLRTETSRRLVCRLLALPASATTVAVIAGPQPAAGGHDLTVRLAAPDAPSLDFAAESLGKVLAGERAHARRLDGEHLEGLAATLPLGGGALGVPGRRHEDHRLDGLELPVAASGLMLGCNRRGEPVVARLFRPEQTRALLVGGVRCAQLIALRAMALGARVVVQTARPQVWSPFARGVALPGKSIAVIPPGRVVELPPGSVLHPLLVIVDVGPVGADIRPGAGFQATLVVRDDFSPADVDVAIRADLLILQPLTPDEATLAGAALGLGEAAQWLTRIRADMIGVVNRRAVRWALLTQTPIEAQLVGPPDRD